LSERIRVSLFLYLYLWDFVVDIDNADPEVFENFYKDFPYKDEVDIAKEFSILSAIEKNDTIIASNIIFHSQAYPFYFDLNKTTTNQNWEVYVSKDLYDSLDTKTLSILGTDFDIWWYYSSKVWWVFSDFLWNENVLLPFENLEKIKGDDTNTLIEKNYYFKLKDQNSFDKINTYLETKNSRESWLRIRDYKNGWNRFEDIISNLRSYINYAVLFSFLLTSTIIFIAISSFFINERKSISILKILWLQNSKLINFIIILFSFILALSLIIWFLINSTYFRKYFHTPSYISKPIFMI